MASTADDEALARALQEQFEKEAAAAAGDTGRSSRGRAERKRARRAKQRRTKEQGAERPSARPSSRDGSQDAGPTPLETPQQQETDEEMARRLQQELKDQEIARRTAAREKKSHTNNHEIRTTADTPEELSRKDRGRSQHKRTIPPSDTQERSQHKRTISPAPSAQDPGHHKRTRSPAPSAKEQSQHRRAKSPPPEAKSQSQNKRAKSPAPTEGRSQHKRITPPQDVANKTQATQETDEEMARRLQQELKDQELARKLQKKEQFRATEETKRKRSATPDPPQSREETDAEIATDPKEATESDEDMARRLQQEMKDEEMARRLQKKEKTRSRKRKEKESNEETPPAVPSAPPSEQDAGKSTSPSPPPVDISQDEELAKRLQARDAELAKRMQQEERDEELARRLNEQETRRKRRTSITARRAHVQRRRASINAALPGQQEEDGERVEVTLTPAAQNTTIHATTNLTDRGRSKSPAPRSHSKSPPPVPRDRHAHSRGPVAQHGVHRSTDAYGTKKKDIMMSPPEQAPPPPPSNDDSDLDDEDLEFAMKLDQEAKDEMLARSISRQELRRVSVYRVGTPGGGGSGNRRGRNGGRAKWSFRRIMSLVVPAVIILAAVVGLAFVFGGGNGLPTLPGVGTPPIFDDTEDPFAGVNPDDANKWNTGNKNDGLRLEVLNALQSQWNDVFKTAIAEWDDGSPDALSLDTVNVQIDSECEPVQGTLKVCNGNYGETRWRGINQVLLSNGFIISSVAKLNEFYLATADEHQRQYTMCHEIGHGFGLPHTDEDFFNPDLGNCMDYTSNPEVNKNPDQSNYLFLFDLYGLIPPDRRRTTSSGSEPIAELPEAVLLSYKDAMHELFHERDISKRKYASKLLEMGPHTAHYMVALTGDYFVEVSLLLAES